MGLNGAVVRDGRIYQPEEDEVLERFNRDYRPWFEKHGSEIGQTAMMGDQSSTEVILRYQSFSGWLTDESLRALDRAIRAWERRRLN